MANRRRTSRQKEEKTEESGKGWSLIGALLTIIIAYGFFPETYPFGFMEFWFLGGDPSASMFDRFLVTMGDCLSVVWPVFVFGVVFNIAYFWLFNNKADWQRDNPHPWKILFSGMVVSTVAGVLEELIFRWVLFYAQIAWLTLVSFCFFGFLGFGITEFLHLWVFGPIADFTTFGFLESYLYYPEGYWAVGAGMLGANAFFRNGHKYQGFLGYTVSWFMGMVFFWVMFQWGLLAAIIVHFLYDLAIFTYAAFRQLLFGLRTGRQWE